MGLHCIAFHCSHLYITNPGCVCHFAKTWVSLQTTTYISKSTKYFGINLLLTWEQLLHAPTVQIWAQNSIILTPNNLLTVCHSSITNWSQKTFFRNGGNFPISGCYASTLTLNSERVFYEQFVSYLAHCILVSPLRFIIVVGEEFHCIFFAANSIVLLFYCSLVQLRYRKIW